MKCDELKTVCYIDAYSTMPVYGAKEVDAAIAELKEFAKDACLERDDNQNVINELEAENRRLKRALWMARAERAMAESYSVLNDVSKSNKWVKALGKLKTKAEEYK